MKQNLSHRKFLFAVLTGLLVYGTCEFLFAKTLKILQQTKGICFHPKAVTQVFNLPPYQKFLWRTFRDAHPKGQLIVRDPLLGWGYIPGRGSEHFSVNSQGIRSNREYAFETPQDKIRIAAFGDSFTACSWTSLPESWPTLLETREPWLEVLNFGVSGYGLDQAYLRYRRDGPPFNPDIVIIGYLPENIRRNVNRFRSFYAEGVQLGLTKPRFILIDEKLQLLPSFFANRMNIKQLLTHPEQTLREMGRHDYYYDFYYPAGALDFLPSVRLFKITKQSLRQHFWSGGLIYTKDVYNRSSEAYQVTLKIFDAFYESVRAEGAIPIIVIYPLKTDIKRGLKGKPRCYRPLVEDFEKRGYSYIDLFESFRGPVSARPLRDFMAKDGYHYSVLGNRIVAEAIHDYLIRNDLLPPGQRKDPFGQGDSN